MFFYLAATHLPSAIALGRTRRGNDSPKGMDIKYKSSVKANVLDLPRYTHGVGPQNMENEKTCSTAKAISVSPSIIVSQSSQAPKTICDLPPRLLRGVSWSVGVPEGANVKCPTRPAWMSKVPRSRSVK